MRERVYRKLKSHTTGKRSRGRIKDEDREEDEDLRCRETTERKKIED